MGFKIKAFDGTPLEIQDGDYYFNSKARGRRMMGNSLSADARRVYACLELATMGFQQELAVTMERGEQRPLAPSDIQRQTGLSKQHVRRGLEELENQGLAQRLSDDQGPLRNGHIEIYSWAVPRAPIAEKVAARGYLPDWFPESWAPLKPLINRFKYSLIDDEVAARGYLEEIAEAARGYQEAEKVAMRALEKVCARTQKARPSLYRKNGKNLERKEASSSSAVQVLSPPPKAEEEKSKSAYQEFKAAYPGVVDDAKVKPAFERKTPAQQAHIMERLRLYLACDRWKDRGGQFIPFADKWLEKCDYDPPPAFKPAGTAPAKKGFTDSVLEEAKRRFDKYGRV